MHDSVIRYQLRALLTVVMSGSVAHTAAWATFPLKVSQSDFAILLSQHNKLKPNINDSNTSVLLNILG